MKNRNAHGAAQFFFNHETIRRLDVLQIDAAERRFQHLAGANDIPWVAGSQLQIEDIDIGEAFEENALAFHHRLTGLGTDVAQAQHGGTIGHHRDQISLGGVLVGKVRLLLDFQTRNRDTGGIGEAQIALRGAGFGRRNRNLPGRSRRVVLQHIFFAYVHLTSVLASLRPSRGILVFWL